MDSKLKIWVELTIDNPHTTTFDDAMINRVKHDIESTINNGTLASACFALGNYLDAEVVKIKLEESYDTRTF